MNIKLIGMPQYYGCGIKGTDLTYKYLMSKDIKFKNKVVGTKSIDVLSTTELQGNIKYIKEIMEANKKLYDEVKNNLSKSLSILIGGDHASVIGNIASELDYYKGDVTIIWVDAHLDIHTDKTTPSGNVHGMPLSILMGNCDSRFDIGNAKLNSDNLIYIGTRSYEEEELDIIEKNNIKNYTYQCIIDNGLENVLKEVLSNIKTKYVHISFDFDFFGYEYFKSVNVAYEKKYMVNEGPSIEDGKLILKTLLNNLNVVGIDLVEYNPIMDKFNDINTVLDIIKVIDDN
jgi:arginase